jgi:hypothetical protein
MCLMPLDVFVSDKLQNRLEDVLLKLCFNESRSENRFKLRNFDTSFSMYLWIDTANKIHKFGGHKYIDYLISLSYYIPRGHFHGYHSATTGMSSGILHYFSHSKRNKLAVSNSLQTSKHTREIK